MRLILFLFALIILCGCTDKKFRQPANSAMAPTIQPSEIVAADMSAYKKATPKRWDVVVFQPPVSVVPAKTVWTFRVAGLPGERISFENNVIHIDGKPVPPPAHLRDLRYSVNDLRMPSAIAFPYAIAADSYFLLGDNTTNAFDSRFWGALPAQSILGRVKNK